MGQHYPQQTFSSGADQSAYDYVSADYGSADYGFVSAEAFPMPCVPGWSTEEIQYLFTLRQAPGYEILFMSEHQHTIPEMSKKLAERFGHHQKYVSWNVNKLWKHLLANWPSKRPTAVVAPQGPQTHVEAQPGQSHSLAAPLSNFGGGLYEEPQSYHSQQYGQTNASPSISGYGPPSNAYPPFATGQAGPEEQCGGRHMSRGASYPFPPDASQQSRAIAPHAPMSGQNYNDDGGFAMMPGMGQGLPPHWADYSSPNFQTPFQNRGALAGQDSFGQHHQFPQGPVWAGSISSGGLTSDQRDQNRHGGLEDFGDFNGELNLPTTDDMEDNLQNILHNHRFEDPDDSSDGLDVPSTMEMEDDFKRMFPDIRLP